MYFSKTLKFLSLALVIFSQTTALADGTNSTGFVRPLLGLGVVNNSGGTNFTYGVGGGYKINPEWSVGLDLTYNTFTVPSPLTANMLLILASGMYHFDQYVPGLSGGLKLGAGTVSYSGGGANSPGSATNLAWGPTVGYDYSLNSQWTVGGEANLLWISNSNPGVSVFQVLANAKYWF